METYYLLQEETMQKTLHKRIAVKKKHSTYYILYFQS